MDRSGNTPLGMVFLSDNVIHVDNALIEEVVVNNARTGYLVITFEVSEENSVTYMEEIRLNIGGRTIIIDENGRPLNLYDLSVGMRIDADFSAAMTRSIPPQSNAYRIVVLEEEPSVEITMDRVISVDTRNNFLLTGNPNDVNDQFIFTISRDTLIRNQDNRPISLREIQPGQMVRVEHANFQTLSIPPQSPAYRVQVI